MISILPEYIGIWNSIKAYFDEDQIHESKINKQLEIFKKWTTLRAIGYVEAVTGFGKTMIAIISIMRLNIKAPDKTIIVVVPNQNLLNDWIDEKQGYIRTFFLRNVKVYVVNTYTMSNIDRNCDLLILDEVHRYLGENSEFFSTVIASTTYKYLLALSATLGKSEKEFLSKFDIQRVAEITLDEAETNNWVSKFMIYNIGVNLEEEERENLGKLDDLHTKYYGKFNFDFELASACQKKDATRIYHKKKGITKTSKQWRNDIANKYGTTEGEVRKWAGLWFYYMRERKTAIHKAKAKIEILEELLNKVDKKTIVFSEYTEIADTIHKRMPHLAKTYHSNIPTQVYLNDTVIGEGIGQSKYEVYGEVMNWPSVKKLHPLAERYGGNKLKAKIKKDFEENKFKYLLTSKALDEGFDCRDIMVGIIHSGTSVKRQGVQRIGRIIRSYEDKYAIIINIYVKDSQDKTWLEKRLKGLPPSKIRWVDTIDQINFEPKSVKLVA